MPYVGNNITVVCGVQLFGVVDGSDVDVAVTWSKDGSEVTGVPGRVITTGAISSGGFVQNILSFTPLLSSDSGMYGCDATVTSRVPFIISHSHVNHNRGLDVAG